MLVAAAICGLAAGQFLKLWPLYALIIVIGLLARYKDGFIKYGSLCGVMALIAHAIYLSEQRITVVTPFIVSLPGKPADFLFDGETAANFVRDGMNSFEKVAQGEPGRFPCSDSEAPSEISRAFTASLAVDPHLVVPIPSSAVALQSPEKIELEVKGVSLAAIQSAARIFLGSERTISGDVIADGTNSFVMVARSSDGAGPWQVGPYPITEAGLRSAGCQMAEYVLKDIDPNMLGEAFLNSGHSVGAILLYNEGVSADVRYSHDALMLDGAARLQNGGYDAAITRFNQALKADKADPEAYESLGMAYAGKGDFDSAFRQLDLALKLMPRSERARNAYDRGVAYFLKRDYEQSIKAFGAALQMRPEYVSAAFYRGQAFKANKQYSEAIKAYQSALELHQAHAVDAAIIQIALGDALDTAGKPKEAIEAYKGAQSHYFAQVLQSSALFNRYMYAEIDLMIATAKMHDLLDDRGAKEAAEAVNVLDKVLAENPNYWDATSLRLEAHVLHGMAEWWLKHSEHGEIGIPELSQAITGFEAISKTQKLTAEQAGHLGESLVVRGIHEWERYRFEHATSDANEAITVLQQAPVTDSSNFSSSQTWLGEAHSVLGRVARDRRNTQLAINEFTEALKLNPGSPADAVLLGTTYVDAGKKQVKVGKQAGEALKNFDEAIRILRPFQGGKMRKNSWDWPIWGECRPTNSKIGTLKLSWPVRKRSLISRLLESSSRNWQVSSGCVPVSGTRIEAHRSSIRGWMTGSTGSSAAQTG